MRPRLALVKESLRRAADLIDENGWFGDHPDNDSPPPNTLCALLAIGKAVGDDHALWNAATSRFRESIGGTSIIGYNDAPGRTAAEVTAALRAAAQ